MEDQPQHHYQCVDEVQKCKFLVADLKDTYGPVAILTLNDDPLAKINAHFCDVMGHEYDGETRTILIMKN